MDQREHGQNKENSHHYDLHGMPASVKNYDFDYTSGKTKWQSDVADEQGKRLIAYASISEN
jgi:hypothetical protein